MNLSELNNLFYEKPIQPALMGILNLDTESFYKPSIAISITEALNRTGIMLHDGMDILDIGAFSSRPGMKIPALNEERSRLMPFIKAIRAEFPDIIISVDTMRSEIAREAIESGVELINDISGGVFDSELPKIVSSYKKVYIAMHMKGLPENMMKAENTSYDDILHDLITHFIERINTFHQIGLDKVIVDPGFGFSKTLNDNYKVLNNLNLLEILNKPILVGLSRKSMIWKTIQTNAIESLHGSLVAAFFACLKSCHILRIHDIKETKQMISVYRALQQSS